MFPLPFRNVALGAALALTLAAPALAAPLPRVEADSMGGTHVVLPQDASGKRLALLIAFTPESEAQLKEWSKKIIADNAGEKNAVYVVVVAANTAFFAHGKVRKIVQNAGIGTQDQINQRVLLTFNGSGWKTLTPPGDKNTIGVVVADASGNVEYAKRAAFNPANLADVEKLLAK